MSDSKSSLFWRYAFEFILVFAAVFLGFLAESYRENVSERERERDYATSLVSDLNDDVNQLKRIIELNDNKLQFLDSLIAIGERPHGNIIDNSQFSRCAGRGLCCAYFFKSNDATLTLLKYADGFRLFRRSVADSISAYDVNLRQIYAEERQYEHNNFRAFEIALEFGNMRLQYNGTPTNFPFGLPSKERLFYFFNNAADVYESVRSYNEQLKQQQVRAEKLMRFLLAEYNLNPGVIL